VADDSAVLTLDLPDRDEACSAARKALTALNGSLHLVSEPRLRDAQILVTELVANALRHGTPDPVRLSVYAQPDIMRVEVHDSGAGFDPHQLAPPVPENAGHWGLHVVAALAHRWGVSTGPDTTVWFEIDRPQRDTSLPIRPTPPS
jgi:anti-sigma regulatory factor (Ser/Thr protein kinase)